MLPWNRKPKPPAIEVGAQTHVGLVRAENQDHLGHFAGPGEGPPEGPGPERLFVVADGMGGHEDGERASRSAVEVVREAYFADPSRPPEERLRRALEAANARVFEQAQGLGEGQTMGTTCTALALVGAEAFLAHVGDSRAYRVGRAGIRQLTRDHTLVEVLQREGVLSEAEAAAHPRRHALVRAIGIRPEVEVDTGRLEPPRPGEAFVLCSDGLAGVSEDELGALVRERPAQEAADALVALANERGGLDNVTVLVVKIV